MEEIIKDLEKLEEVKVGLSKENPGASALLKTAMARNTKSSDPNDWDDVLEIEEERECKGKMVQKVFLNCWLYQIIEIHLQP